MSFNLNVNHTNINFTPIAYKKEYIVIHYTGNITDTAKANANYFKDVNRGASAHFFVDETTGYEVVDPTLVAWAVGRNFGSNNLFGIVNNNNSISIEMCSTNGEIANATFENTVALTKDLMKRFNIPVNNVVRHYDVCSKQCPGWSGWGTKPGDQGILWNKFKNSLSGITGCAYDSLTAKEGVITVSGWSVIDSKGSNDIEIQLLQNNKIIKSVKTLANKERADVKKALGLNISNVGFKENIQINNEGSIKVRIYNSKQCIGEKTCINTYSLHYRAYCQSKGWMPVQHSGSVAGTEGQGLRMEAIKIDMPNAKIYAAAHIQGKGDVDYGLITKDTIIGTINENKRLESLYLKGQIQFRVHQQNTGWTRWANASNGVWLGVKGKSLRLEAIEIKLL